MAITGQDNTSEWYRKNRNKIELHADTQDWVEGQLEIQRR
jgi:hypothetical protein